MLLTNCEINVIITWYENCVISSAIKKTKFTIKDTKIYVPIVTLSTQVNAKLLELLNSCFKRTISWNKQQAKVPTDKKNWYLYFLIDSSFQEVNGLFIFLFQNQFNRIVHTRYFLSKVEIKD